jgi:hypothetical protein
VLVAAREFAARWSLEHTRDTDCRITNPVTSLSACLENRRSAGGLAAHRAGLCFYTLDHENRFGTKLSPTRILELLKASIERGSKDPFAEIGEKPGIEGYRECYPGVYAPIDGPADDCFEFSDEETEQMPVIRSILKRNPPDRAEPAKRVRPTKKVRWSDKGPTEEEVLFKNN